MTSYIWNDVIVIIVAVKVAVLGQIGRFREKNSGDPALDGRDFSNLLCIGCVIDVIKTSLLCCLASWPVHSVTMTSITHPIRIQQMAILFFIAERWPPYPARAPIVAPIFFWYISVVFF